jgi:hypothetical protein
MLLITTALRSQAVLSIDDDLVTPCQTLDDAFNVWQSNKKVLVGFSPRMHTYDIVTGTVQLADYRLLTGFLFRE